MKGNLLFAHIASSLPTLFSNVRRLDQLMFMDLGWKKPYAAKQVHHKQIGNTVHEAYMLNKHTHSQATNKIYPNTLS